VQSRPTGSDDYWSLDYDCSYVIDASKAKQQ
jgi:hypothetical protein